MTAKTTGQPTKKSSVPSRTGNVNGRSTTPKTTRPPTTGNLERNTTVNPDSVTTTVKQKYGDNASISRSTTDGKGITSETISYEAQRGKRGTSQSITTKKETGTRTTSTTDSERQVKYKSGGYSNEGNFASNNYKNGSLTTTRRHESETGTRVSKETTKTTDYRADKRGTEAEEAARADERQARADKRDGQQAKLDMLADGLNLKATAKTKSENVVGAETQKTVDGRVTTETLVGPQAGTKTYGEASIGVNGLSARGDVEARAGLYAEGSKTYKGDNFDASGKAGAKLEAKAQANGTASLGVNGLRADGYAGAGVEASAEVEGEIKTKALKVGDAELTAGAKVKGRVAAEAKAEATGKVAITGDPPTAVVSGEAGASAVVKAEGEAKVNAGPFSVKAQGYASAGAEAKVGGTLGYEDGKLKIGFNAGAALGVGLGGRVQAEVDVEQIGQVAQAGYDAAHKAADVTGDGRFGLDDAKVYGETAVNAAVDTAEAAVEGAKAVGEAAVEGAKAVGEAAVEGAKAVGEAAVEGAKAVGEAAYDGAKAVGRGAKRAASAAVDTVGRGAKAAANTVGRGAKAVKNFFTGWW